MALGVSEISLAWNPSVADDLKCYNVYRSMWARDYYEYVASPGEAYYYDKGLDPAVTYYYCIVAIDNADNMSEQSPVISATTRAPVVVELFSRSG